MVSKISIIKGTIYNENNELVWNAVIQLTEINPTTKDSIVLGYTLTDVNGKYAFSLEGKSDRLYQVTIFPPLDA